jgi:hypothetical protein
VSKILLLDGRRERREAVGFKIDGAEGSGWFNNMATFSASNQLIKNNRMHQKERRGKIIKQEIWNMEYKKQATHNK